jgi:hypothetical protein
MPGKAGNGKIFRKPYSIWIELWTLFLRHAVGPSPMMAICYKNQECCNNLPLFSTRKLQMPIHLAAYDMNVGSGPYRHAVELALKGIAWNADEIAGRLGKPLSGRLWFTKAPRELDAPYSRK